MSDTNTAPTPATGGPKALSPLEIRLGSLRLRNPVLAASGAFGSGGDYHGLIDNALLGGFVTKSVTLHPRRGNPHPRVAETPSGMLNSIGLENPGIDRFLRHEWVAASAEPCAAVLSVAGGTPEEYAELCAKAEAVGTVPAIEINLSCPNVKEGGRTFGADPGAVEGILRRCRAETSAFLVAKLTPNADPAAVAEGAEAGGADAVSLINTLIGMAIDVERKRPKLAMGTGGLSGPAIRPVAVAMVHRVHRAVGIPVIGIGGIASAEDALEFLLAGASAVQVGTALFTDPGAMGRIIAGLSEYCTRHGHASIREVTGALEGGDLLGSGGRT
ncbi:MAG: dihydroorotate dehydrogenase [Gemmatimonadota bacterium]|jgi:dihydroorotate dehydrogenase (NAD+) catalytic subunit|nr:dihydroorotate dehydrogenase B catalytic subunit [Gemmatimonadota bacterium]MDP6460993.1 dihydroorotate dehydrogenase [Gemmatimonadota bacterium]MDP6528747.1 dihydroorotate dehydrogenase [Gemmatimonadota bacterium]MDP6803196.1 dihydroorotate dehydrogenase [Gemmatimonadota bacterium]MDP7031266.1 dihydroorotate dehydrogenase [Gemmatimonadota bacterium]